MRAWLRFLNDKPGSFCDVGGGNDRGETVDALLDWLIENRGEMPRGCKYEWVILEEALEHPLPKGLAKW